MSLDLKGNYDHDQFGVLVPPPILSWCLCTVPAASFRRVVLGLVFTARCCRLCASGLCKESPHVLA